MLGSQWYHGLIKKYVATFGTLFNDIEIIRFDENNNTKQVLKVPLTYAPKDKVLVRITADPNIDREAAIVLPRMAFEMGNPTYDSDRKLNTIGSSTFKGSTANKLQRLYNPVPYNLPFSLFIYVKNTEDGTKIVEQILPMFTPEFTVSVYLLPDVGLSVDVPIELINVMINDQYEGSFIERKVLIWQLDFILKGYLYGPIKEKPIIKFVNTSFYSATSPNTTLNPVAKILVTPGLTTNGEPTSNSINSIDVNLIEVDDDFGYCVEIQDNLIKE